MPRFLASFLIASFLISPLAVFAQKIRSENPNLTNSLSVPTVCEADQSMLALSLPGASSTVNISITPTGTCTEEGGTTATSSIAYTVPDPILSSHLISTDEQGNATEVVDYGAYGSMVSDEGTGRDARGYIGEYADNTGLSYLNARYYDASRGMFLSEDPVFWEIGQTEAGKKVLLNPQSLNSYGYSLDNPINVKDPSGLLASSQSPEQHSVLFPLR